MGTNEIINNRIGATESSKGNKIRFEQLPEEERKGILSDYHHIQRYAQRPVWQKFRDGIRAVLLEILPFEMA